MKSFLAARLAALLCFAWLGLSLAAEEAASRTSVVKPRVPLSVSSRWIVDAGGRRVKLRCINWAGHLEANIPEGLHRQSVEHTADWIASQGFNCVRLTYSIDMALDSHVRVEDSFRRAAKAAGVDEAAMMRLYATAVDKNRFLAGATIIDVFDRVQSALWDRGVMTVLDNHVSRASWCCDLGDGNGWWKDAPLYMSSNSRFFDTAQWHAGLASMATWSRSRPGIIGLSLRNELRASVTQLPFGPDTWLSYMPVAARLVHAANPAALIIVGGINGGTDLSPLRLRAMDDAGWRTKRVWEAHSYSFTVTTPSFGICPLLQAEYGGLYGFVLEQDRPWTGPLFLSEFGVGMTGGPRQGMSDKDARFLDCLSGYMAGNDADWALWAVQGSYYVRGKTVDHNETWGALDYEWRDWRNPSFKAKLSRMLGVTQGP
ncbi:hypothetical protein CDD80_823 [Ophiocordyceps camponoti-rufipedis]|uniref:Glycoside hydrolase family 5 domain-containing protein n=1 Tax=Ophiocordyceps camponoti-rufipedis TaxID=2004952 RepID=A0A2C5Z856_9HYPO|nr:hypothetical protein CDD80_823 [Ophiocordyceps camponoti-rufipedis]